MIDRQMNGFEAKEDEEDKNRETTDLELVDQDLEPPPPPAPEPSEPPMTAEEAAAADDPPPPTPPAPTNPTVDKFENEFVQLETAKESYA